MFLLKEKHSLLFYENLMSLYSHLVCVYKTKLLPVKGKLKYGVSGISV